MVEVEEGSEIERDSTVGGDDMVRCGRAVGYATFSTKPAQESAGDCSGERARSKSAPRSCRADDSIPVFTAACCGE